MSVACVIPLKIGVQMPKHMQIHGPCAAFRPCCRPCTIGQCQNINVRKMFRMSSVCVMLSCEICMMRHHVSRYVTQIDADRVFHHDHASRASEQSKSSPTNTRQMDLSDESTNGLQILRPVRLALRWRQIR